MAEIQQGRMALVYGAPSMTMAINGGTALGFTGNTAIVLSEMSVTRTADTVETRDAAGDIANITTYNAGNEVTLTIMPAGNTRANAKTVADQFPKIGGYAVLVSATDVTHLDNAARTATAGGVTLATTGVPYQISAASKNSTGGGKVTWTLTLREQDAITSWVPLT